VEEGEGTCSSPERTDPIGKELGNFQLVFLKFDMVMKIISAYSKLLSCARNSQ
jgi:hypothetical protein